MSRLSTRWPPLALSMISFVCRLPMSFLSRIVHRKLQPHDSFGPRRAKYLSQATQLLLPSDLYVPWPVWVDSYFAPHPLFDPVPRRVLKEEEEMILKYKATILKRYHEWLQQLPLSIRDRLDLNDGPIFRYLFDYDQYDEKFRKEIMSIEEDFGYKEKKNQ